jgi:pimeloyl-ACP methyl ester carboxylesterase
MAGAVGLETRQEIVPVWDGRVGLRVQIAGTGPPIVYLHSAAGLAWDPFLERMAGERTVYAPQVPGTASDDAGAIAEVDDLWDLVLLYEEALRRLGLERSPLIGSSFGGMLACELAAAFPGIAGRLVLLDPIGLWRDDLPVANWVMTPPEELPALLFHEPEGPAAQAALAMPEDPEAMISAIAGFAWTIGCTAKFVWPVPDKGLAKRLHRIEAPTLVIWGKQDRLISVEYAKEFSSRIGDCRVELIDECGHVPQAERMEATLELVRDFLAGP